MNTQVSANDDIVISPTKNLNFLHNNLSGNIPGSDTSYQIFRQQQYEYEDEPIDEEKLAEKKRKKNQKKKRKRKEKKILAQHNINYESLYKEEKITLHPSIQMNQQQITQYLIDNIKDYH